MEFILDFLKLVENPHFNDEKLLNILRSEIIDVENIDVITLSRELYRKNYSKSGFKLNMWDLIKNIDVDYSRIGQTQGMPLQDKNCRGESCIHPDEKQALFEINLEEKYKNYKKIIEFRDLILELNQELGLY